ncbi:hypothetical protein FACS1894166_04670 [Bacilli bacterium]|nr:hypothetical protein FACS1894166_04670 [Bacilli bacterium]
MDGSGNVTSTIIADTDTDILFNYDGSVNILFGYSTTVTTINFMNETVLVYMDVSRLPNLTFFSSQTPSPLSILDLSHNPLLQNIQLNNTNLLTLDVSHNPLLETFVVGSSRLQAIDVSHNPLLTTVEISDAFLTTLDLTCNPALQKAYVVRNNLYTLYLPDTPADVDLELEIGDNANLANIYTMAMQNPTGATFTILSAYGDNNPQYTYHLKPGSEATFAGGTYSGGDVA